MDIVHSTKHKSLTTNKQENIHRLHIINQWVLLGNSFFWSTNNYTFRYS